MQQGGPAYGSGAHHWGDVLITRKLQQLFAGLGFSAVGLLLVVLVGTALLGLVLDPWSSCCRQWGQHGGVGTEQERTRYSRGDLQLQQLCAGFMAGVVM